MSNRHGGGAGPGAGTMVETHIMADQTRPDNTRVLLV